MGTVYTAMCLGHREQLHLGKHGELSRVTKDPAKFPAVLWQGSVRDIAVLWAREGPPSLQVNLNWRRQLLEALEAFLQRHFACEVWLSNDGDDRYMDAICSRSGIPRPELVPSGFWRLTFDIEYAFWNDARDAGYDWAGATEARWIAWVKELESETRNRVANRVGRKAARSNLKVARKMRDFWKGRESNVVAAAIDLYEKRRLELPEEIRAQGLQPPSLLSGPREDDQAGP